MSEPWFDAVSPAHPRVGPESMDGSTSKMSPYPSDLEREVCFSDGTCCHLRPIRSDDGERLVAFHSHLSARSTYLRFFTFHPTLTPNEVERFTHVDYENRLALVVEGGEEGKFIAVGRFDRHVGTADAEVAFVVADEYQHHGIGSLLLDELAQAARARGIETFLADTLSENRTMLGVFLHSGFEVTTKNEFDTVTLRFGIAPTETYRAALAARELSRQVTGCPLVEVARGASKC